MNLALIRIQEYWGESGTYADHILGEYLVKKEKDYAKKIDGLRKVCEEYEDWDEVEEYVYKNFEVVEYYNEIIQIND